MTTINATPVSLQLKWTNSVNRLTVGRETT
jgi:hypothetical protein